MEASGAWGLASLALHTWVCSCQVHRAVLGNWWGSKLRSTGAKLTFLPLWPFVLHPTQAPTVAGRLEVKERVPIPPVSLG